MNFLKSGGSNVGLTMKLLIAIKEDAGWLLRLKVESRLNEFGLLAGNFQTADRGGTVLTPFVMLECDILKQTKYL